MIWKFVIAGDCPSKKNSKQIWRTGSGRPFITASKNYKNWSEIAICDLLAQKCPVSPLASVSVVHMVFYPKTARDGDLDNKAGSVMDVLCSARVISDDNWYVVPEISLRFGGVDKSNPRVEIEIQP